MWILPRLAVSLLINNIALPDLTKSYQFVVLASGFFSNNLTVSHRVLARDEFGSSNLT